MRSLALWPTTHPITDYEPKFFDDCHLSETIGIFIQESFRDSRPSNLHDSEISDYTRGRAFFSPLFTQEREEEPAGRTQAYHSPGGSLLSGQSSSVGHVRTVRPVDEFGSPISNARENPRRDSECAEIQKSEFQADHDRSIQKLNGVIESQRGEINHALQGDEQLRRDQQLLHAQLLQQNWELREANYQSLNEMEELKRFQGSTFDTIARRRLVQDRDTIFGTFWQDTGIHE